MKTNLIILTHGWTGSSVFTGLISKAGYWFGDDTLQKPDYNTYENIELVELNNRMLKELSYEGDREHEIITDELIDALTRKADTIDLTPYKEFVERCHEHKPWIWKDPRLAYTIHIWARFLPLKETSFIVLTRDIEQLWISCNLRRHIQSREFTEKYNTGLTNSLKSFLTENQLEFLEFEFEDLQLTPEDTIEKLNKYLDVNLTMDDLRSIYKFPLYKKTKGFKEKLTAWLIYLKNYRYRDGRNKPT